MTADSIRTDSGMASVDPVVMHGPRLGEGAALARPYRFKLSAAHRLATYVAHSGAAYSAMVEIADRCNEACVHCYQVQGQKGELATAEWERIFEELAAMGVMFLTISGGEPTLRKDFLQLVRHARRLRFAVKIYSNALNITETMAAEFGHLAVQEVQISLYSHRPEGHDSVTRVPGSFHQVVAAVGYLRRAGVHVVLKTPLMRSNVHEFREYIEFVSSLDAEYTLDPQLSGREDGDLSPLALSIDQKSYFALQSDPRLARPKVSAAPPRALNERPCGACAGNVHVEANGEMRPCTQWSVATGHALADGVANAFRDNEVANTIRGLTWETLAGCRVCDLREYCKRCFADAEREVGSALLPYPSACRTACWHYQMREGVPPDIVDDRLAPAVGKPDAPSVGPYRRISEHRFRAETIQFNPADEALRTASPWLRGAPPTSASFAATGQLLQIRRSKDKPLNEPADEPLARSAEPAALSVLTLP